MLKEKILLINLLVILLINNSIVKADTIEDLVNDINDIQNEMKSLSTEVSAETKILDQSIEEINKITNFALEKVNNGELDTAISALNYTNKSIGDVGKIIPKEFESDMSNADLENFAPEKMETLKEITSSMSAKKEENKDLLLDQIIELNEIGFNTKDISERLISLGVNTVTIIELDNRKFDKIKSTIVENQLNISEKHANLKQLEEKIDPIESQIRTLESQKEKITSKYNSEISTTTSKEDLTKTYEDQLATLDEKINKFQNEAKSINSSMDNLNIELEKLNEIQTITAKKAKEVIPDAALSIKFNYENTSISKDAARVGAMSLGKSQEDWAKSWKGEIETTKIVDGAVINLTEEEIQSVKADLAMGSAIKAFETGEISENLSIDTSELEIATSISASVMIETLQKQSEYLSYAVKEGMHVMTTESAMEGVKSLGKSQADWASAWTGDDPTTKNINGVNIALTVEEIQATKAEWAMNRAAQAIMEGKSLSDLNIDTSEIQEATANAAQKAMAEVQQKAADIASQVSSTAEAVQNMSQGLTEEVGAELAASITEVVEANESLASNVAERAIESVEELEDYLDIDVSALVEDTSSWTEADWAEQWTGDPATHKNVNGEIIELTAEEQQKIHAEWAKNRAEQYGN